MLSANPSCESNIGSPVSLRANSVKTIACSPSHTFEINVVFFCLILNKTPEKTVGRFFVSVIADYKRACRAFYVISEKQGARYYFLKFSRLCTTPLILGGCLFFALRLTLDGRVGRIGTEDDALRSVIYSYDRRRGASLCLNSY